MRHIRTHSSTTRRRRFGKDRRGQVAAVATLFGLLIVVSLISELAIAPLPTEEENAELQHQLQVETQLGELQSDLVLESESPSVRSMISAPVTLGSAPVPPFGSAAPGQLSISESGGLSLNLLAPKNPNFGNGGTLCPKVDWTNGTNTYSCSSTTSSQCHPPLSEGFTQSGVSITFTITDSSSCIFLNISGSSDTITVKQTASVAGLVITIVGSNDAVTFDQTTSGTAPTFVVDGSNDVVTLDMTASSTNGLNVVVAGNQDTVDVEFVASSMSATISIYGQDNTYQWLSGNSGSTDTLTTYLIGETFPSTVCPYQNVSNTDTVGTLTNTGTTVTQDIYFQNSVGWSTSLHKAKSGATNGAIWFANTSKTAASSNCASTLSGSITSGFSSVGGGLEMQLENTYSQALTLSLEGGALIEGQTTGPVMIDPPPFNFTTGASGNYANLTFIGLELTASRTASGYGTAAIVTQLVSETVLHATLPVTVGGVVVLATPTLNITTAYPAAWVGYFDGLAPTYLNGTIGCSSSVTIASPYTCLAPPPGQYVSLAVPLNVQTLQITLAVVQISIE